MKRFCMCLCAVVLLGFASTSPVLLEAQEAQKPLPQLSSQAAQPPSAPSTQGFQLGIIVGSDLLSEKSDSSTLASWTKLGIQPSYVAGRFRLSLDFSVRFIVDPSSSSPYSVYASDWIPSDSLTIWDVYVPKIRCLQYGEPETDPLYVSIAPIDSFTLGQGFIVSDYNNTNFLPRQAITGLRIGIDGAGFRFPYFGLEAMAGNLARFDILAARVYLRPLAFLASSALKSAEIGATLALDRNPLGWLGADAASSLSQKFATDKPFMFYGADVSVPIVNSSPFVVSVSGDWAKEPSGAQGISFGLETKTLRFVNFGAQIRYLQNGFIPSYFDSGYDFYRSNRFAYMTSSEPGRFYSAWASHLGFAFAKDRVNLDLAFDGRFAAIPGIATENNGQYPHVKCSLAIQNALFEGFSLNFDYEKFFVGRTNAWAWDVRNVEGTRLGLKAMYDMGEVAVGLNWANGWDPIRNKIDTFAGLAATVRILDSTFPTNVQTDKH